MFVSFRARTEGKKTPQWWDPAGDDSGHAAISLNQVQDLMFSNVHILFIFDAFIAISNTGSVKINAGQMYCGNYVNVAGLTCCSQQCVTHTY